MAFNYSGTSTKRTHYEADTSIRRTEWRGTDCFALRSNYLRKNLYKAATFFRPGVRFLEIPLYDQFHATGIFICPLKISENVWFSAVFMGHRKRSVAWNRFMKTGNKNRSKNLSKAKKTVKLTCNCLKSTIETLENGVACSKLTIKTPQRCHWRRSGVFIVNFEHISHLFLVLLLFIFEEVKISWENTRTRWLMYLYITLEDYGREITLLFKSLNLLGIKVFHLTL